MEETTDYVYRYRSIDKLFKYNELENLEIYFSTPEELNDQMEDYMNIVWQGDEIAFRGMFKHYLYSLYHLYAIACLINTDEKLDKEQLPIFVQYKDLSLPEMETTFKSIYYEFFDSEEIANIPKLLSSNNRKYSIDEILLIFKTIHLYAYLVINTQVKKDIYKKDLFAEKTYNEEYNFIKHWAGYSMLLSQINQEKNSQNVIGQINNLDLQQELLKIYLNKMYHGKNNHNINILTFEFPELYIRQIKKLLYNNYCIACFSETYQNEPMWSHYADAENGICLKYKIKNFENKKYINLYTITGTSTDRTGTKYNKECCDNILNKVTYSSNYPEINFFKSLGCIPHPVVVDFWLCNYNKTKFSTCCKAYNDMGKWREEYHKKAAEYICTKSENWKYEKECRVFQREAMYSIYNVKENRIAKYNFNDLEAIIFGRKVKIDDKIEIFKIIERHCKSNNIQGFKFYDLYYSTITKRLEIRPCNDYLLFTSSLYNNTTQRTL